jgi:hypothetical protein
VWGAAPAQFQQSICPVSWITPYSERRLCKPEYGKVGVLVQSRQSDFWRALVLRHFSAQGYDPIFGEPGE